MVDKRPGDLFSFFLSSFIASCHLTGRDICSRFFVLVPCPFLSCFDRGFIGVQSNKHSNLRIDQF